MRTYHVKTIKIFFSGLIVVSLSVWTVEAADGLFATNDASQKSCTFIESASEGTLIRINLDSPGDVTVSILGAGGEEVRRLHQGHTARGIVTLLWDGRDDTGVQLPSGTYAVQIVRDGYVLHQEGFSTFSGTEDVSEPLLLRK